MAGRWWRVGFFAGAVLILIGGPQHPNGTMEEMLANPSWVPGHTLVTGGFVAILIGLLLLQREVVLPPRTARWVRLAIIGTTLQVIEMVLHTAAVVDRFNLAAGASTPVLTTHLTLAIVFYPLFAASIIGLIVVAAGEGVLGSRWISIVGMIGALAHGIAAPLVAGLNIERARSLFPGVVLLALWFLAASLWPSRATRRG